MRSSFNGVLSLALSFSVAVLPVLPELHIAFASHAHLYCPEHNRIEDVFVHGDRAPTTEPALPAVAGTVRIDSPACDVSNLVVQSQAGTRPVVTASLVPVVPTLLPPSQSPATRRVLAHAPKHSPPA